MKKLRKIFYIIFARRIYVISKINRGVKYYHMDGSKWTPMFEGAKHYKKKPDFSQINDLHSKIEKYYV